MQQVKNQDISDVYKILFNDKIKYEDTMHFGNGKLIDDMYKEHQDKESFAIDIN